MGRKAGIKPAAVTRAASRAREARPKALIELERAKGTILVSKGVR
jgi:hypothetical protein